MTVTTKSTKSVEYEGNDEGGKGRYKTNIVKYICSWYVLAAAAKFRNVIELVRNIDFRF